MPVDIDYLQVFSLSAQNGRQRVIHTQEVPEYKREYVFNIGTAINAKIYVIDSGTYSIMLFAQEY